MWQLVPGIFLFVYCVFSFCREVRRDRRLTLERDRLGDEHMFREIEKFLKGKKMQKQVKFKREVDSIKH